MITQNNRSQWDIMYDILAFIDQNDNAVRTRVTMASLLPLRDVKKHFVTLQKQGFMTMSKEEYKNHHREVCNITPRGRQFKNRMKAVYDLFGGRRPKW